MTRHVLNGYLTETISMSSIADDWKLSAAATLIPSASGQWGMIETSSASHNRISIAGVIMSDTGALFSGDATEITIDDTAFIYAETGTGLQLDGSNQTLVNNGRIIAAADGIRNLGGASVDNFGLIRAAGTGIVLEAGGTFENHEKSNLIAATGIVAQGNPTLLAKTINDGTITATGAAYTGFAGTDWVINHGTMTGNVTLGDGADTFDTRGGSVSGSISGGNGDDLFYVSSSKIDIIEASNQGQDEVRTISNFTLSANIENLTLIGKDNINGNGNGQDNRLTGNSGNNVLSGKSGIDTLDGGAGRDTLTGGNDLDIFIFASGSGRDTITDFGDGADVINLSGWKAVNGFYDLIHHHLRISGNDLILYSGTDQLVLRGIDEQDLRDTDFIF